jgi:hypothetical protein
VNGAAALQTSNFAAEFGQVVGGFFNFNAKSEALGKNGPADPRGY